ncbi:MAG: hypothetical protein MSS69_11540 [Spirochaetales bacterium]|nr:hypothetical protein [Spirochaetales bacterium]
MIPFLSSRYAFSSSYKQRDRAIRAVVAIALSLVVVNVVISIMDFLQNGRFEDIRDVRSFDIVVEGKHKEELSQYFPGSILFEYGEGEALTSDGAYNVRYISSDYDGGLKILYGDSSSLMVPYSLFRSSSGKITLSMLKKGKAATTMKNFEYSISGIYWTSVGTEFDQTTLFLPLEEADETVYFLTAIKNVDLKEGEKILKELGLDYKTWKEQESSLYAAFFVEKTMMYTVLSLLFVIILVSLRQSVRIFVSSHDKECAELEIMGMGRKKILLMMELSFFLILLLGIVLGLVFGRLALMLVEYISVKSSSILDMALSMSYGSMVFFSLFLIVVTGLSVYFENIKRNKKPLWELIHVK